MTERMKPTLIGFDGPEPYAIVIVNPITSNRFKKVCFDLQELELVLKRYSVKEEFTLEVFLAEEYIPKKAV